MVEVLVLQPNLQVDALTQVHDSAWRLLRVSGLLGLVALQRAVRPEDEVPLVPFLGEGGSQ